jgi:non-specific protein-tyrosine kinase
LSIEHIFAVVWRRRRLFLATVATCFAAVVVVTIVLPRVYSATATLFVSQGADSQNPDQLVRTYSALAGNANVAEGVLTRLPLKLSRSELLKRMSFAPVERTQLVEITATGGTPREARLIANTYAAVFAARVTSRFGAGRVTVSEPASLPTKPSRPNPPVYLLLGFAIAVLLGIAVALIRDRLDPRIRVRAGDEEILGRPLLARVAWSRAARRRDAGTGGIRTALATLDLQHGRPLRKLAIAGADSGEAAARVAAALAIAAVQEGRRVALIEGWHRALDGALPGLSRPPRGVAGYPAEIDEIAVAHPRLPGLLVVRTGVQERATPALPRSERLAELIARLLEEADRVVIAAPPVHAGADASVLASMVDGTIYVVEADRSAVTRASADLRQLDKVRARVLGLVAVTSDGDLLEVVPARGPKADEESARDDGAGNALEESAAANGAGEGLEAMVSGNGAGKLPEAGADSTPPNGAPAQGADPDGAGPARPTQRRSSRRRVS